MRTALLFFVSLLIAAAGMSAEDYPVIPAGSIASVELLEPVDAGKNNPGDVIPGLLARPLPNSSGGAIVPAGAEVKVRLVEIPNYTATIEVEDYALELAAICIGGHWYPVTTGFAQTAAGVRKASPERMPEGTADVDALVSGLGAGEGAVETVVRGAGVSIQVVRGPELDVSAHVIVRFTLAEPLTVRPEERSTS